MDIKQQVLHLLEENSRYTAKNIAAAIGTEEKTVADIIAACEADGTLMGYKALVDWSRTDREYVSAMIEINVRPTKGEGFDSVAQTICAFDEVSSVYLMSGGFDLMVMMEGRSMRDIALFVFEKLAVIDGVSGTATHFVLNKYKDKGIICGEPEKDDRQMFDVI